ncbi:hypothetical protein niasHS_000474 [Heterodera schachtii]|uniref:Uncharacterized protein n=1 Tax=Heterodera schachtii TaxID=97005 RepID=A0ABD2K709_HETSC
MKSFCTYVNQPDLFPMCHFEQLQIVMFQQFLSAISPVNFIICFSIGQQSAKLDDVELFQLDNKRTNERLALERMVLDQQSKVCMTRAPIGRDERKWAEWMRKAWEEEKPHNLIEFMIYERNIGPDI